ncbi:MAG: RIFT barrel domain-containing protein [Kiritimatiellia bacterium]
MRRRGICWLGLLFTVLFALRGRVSGVEVKLEVTETESIARAPALVTTGVPFARGIVKDVAVLALKHGGKSIPTQFARIVSWDDGSVRWALMDTQLNVPAGGKLELVASDDRTNVSPTAPVKIEESAEALRVSNGPLVLIVPKKKSGLIESVIFQGRQWVTGVGGGLVIYDAAGQRVVAGPPDRVLVEQSGPMRSVICVKGTFPGMHNGLLNYTARIQVYAGCPWFKCQVWLENNGAMGYFSAKSEGEASKSVEWFAFDGMAVELALNLGAPINIVF